MAIVFQEFAGGVENLGATMSATYAGPIAQNDLLTAEMFTKSDTTPANPSGWNTDIEVQNAVNTDFLRICSKIAGVSESTTVTFTNLANDRGGLGIMRFTGNATSSQLDQTASTAFTTGVTSLSSGTTGTTTQNDEVSIVAFGIRNVLVSSPSLSNSFILKSFQQDSVCQLIDGYFIETATGTKTSTCSWTTAADPMGAIATYKAAATAGNIMWITA